MTERQRLFCSEYLIDLNAEKAALRAGYSRAYAHGKSYLLLREPNVAGEIQRSMKEREKRMQLSQDAVVTELMKVAFANISDFARIETDAENGGSRVVVNRIEEMSPEKSGAVAAIKQGAKGIEIKLYDKMKALELLARHLGMLRDKVEIEGAQDLQVMFTIPRNGPGMKQLETEKRDFLE